MGEGPKIRNETPTHHHRNMSMPEGHIAHRPITGSEATVICPKCETTRTAKVVLDTPDERFYRCASCHHAWAVTKVIPSD